VDGFPIRIAERLWIVGEERFCHYVLRGEQTTALVEVGVTATAPMVIHQLEQLKIAPDYLIVTHPHVDHITGLVHLQRAFRESTVICGPGAAAFLHHPAIHDSIIHDDRYLSQVLGHPQNIPPLIGDLSCALVPSEGSHIALGGITLQFFSVRGHAPGHIAVFVPEMGALFPSDALGFFLPPTIFFRSILRDMNLLWRASNVYPH